MSRSGYSEDCYGPELNLWRGAVESAIRGKRGQQFLKELLAALDAMPNKRLVADVFEESGEVCTIASLGKAKNIDMSHWVPDDWDTNELVARAFNIAPALVKEIEFENDWDFYQKVETPEERWMRMREWVQGQILHKKP